MNKKIWGVSLTKNVLIPVDETTTKSVYKAVDFKVFRKFSTREEAREFKRSYKNPVSIINLATSSVVR